MRERERGREWISLLRKKAARQQSSLFETSALDALELLSPWTKAIYNSNQLLDEDLWRTGRAGAGGSGEGGPLTSDEHNESERTEGAREVQEEGRRTLPC